MKHAVPPKQTLDDNVVQAILTLYPEDNKYLMRKTFFTIGIFCAFLIDDLDRLRRSSLRFDEGKRRVIISIDQSKTGPCEQVVPGLSLDLPDCPYGIIRTYIHSGVIPEYHTVNTSLETI